MIWVRQPAIHQTGEHKLGHEGVAGNCTALKAERDAPDARPAPLPLLKLYAASIKGVDPNSG